MAHHQRILTQSVEGCVHASMKSTCGLPAGRGDLAGLVHDPPLVVRVAFELLVAVHLEAPEVHLLQAGKPQLRFRTEEDAQRLVRAEHAAGDPQQAVDLRVAHRLPPQQQLRTPRLRQHHVRRAAVEPRLVGRRPAVAQ